MIPAAWITDAIKRIGEKVELSRDGASAGELWASIQPRAAEAGDASGPAGWGAPERFLLYAAAESPALRAGDTILARGARYHVTQVSEYRLSGELLYRHAHLTKGGGVL